MAKFKNKKSGGAVRKQPLAVRETLLRLVGVLQQRHQLPKVDADYILEPLGEKASPAYPGMAFFDAKGNRVN